MTAYWQVVTISTKACRRVQRPLRFPLADPVHRQQAATVPRSFRRSKGFLRCTLSPRPITTTAPPTTNTPPSSIAPPLLRPPPHRLLQRGSVCWASPTHLPIRPRLPRLLLPRIPHTTTITTTTTPITTTPITTTTLPPLPLPPALLALLSLTHRPTTLIPTAPAQRTPLLAPPPPPRPTLPAPHTPHLWASRSLTRVLLLPKCSTDWSERPPRQPERMQRG